MTNIDEARIREAREKIKRIYEDKAGLEVNLKFEDNTSRILDEHTRPVPYGIRQLQIHTQEQIKR